MPARGRRQLSASLVMGVLVTAYLVAAWWPFQLESPRIRNTVVIADSGRLTFDGTSMVRMREPLAWLAPAKQSASLDIRLEARSEDADQEGPARLLSASIDHRSGNVTIAQDGADLVVRLRRPGSSALGTPPLRVRRVFEEVVWRALRLQVADGVARVAVDGEAVRSEVLGPDPLESWRDDVGVALGNEPTGLRGWSGSIRRATVTGGDVTVDLLDPTSYDVPRSWWSKPVAEVYVERADVVRNLLGFVPFGAAWVLVRPGRRPILRAVCASFAMSAAMEVGQLATASRDPSAVDLVVNTTGGAIGAGLVCLGLSLWRPRRATAAS